MTAKLLSHIIILKTWALVSILEKLNLKSWKDKERKENVAT